MNKIRVAEFFAGYGSQRMALERLKRDFPQFDYEVVGISEIESNALKAYEAVHGDCPNWGDICKINPDDISDFDLATWSFPCFEKDTLVLTDKGYKIISDVDTSDSVLTHTNGFRNVYRTMKHRFKGQLYSIKGMGIDIIKCTNEHPFYVRKRYREWNNSLRRWNRKFTAPQWVKAEDLTKDCFLGYAINKKSELPKWDGIVYGRWKNNRNELSRLLDNNDFWYIMGRYVGDGWKRQDENSKGIIICCCGKDEPSLINAIERLGWNYNKAKERTVTKIHICSKELYYFVERFGYKAYGKRIDSETLDLPSNLLSSFIDGYIDSDGYVKNGLIKIASVSRELIYGIAQCIAKVYHRPFSIYKTNRPKNVIIEGRKCNQRDTYTVTFKKSTDKQDNSFYEDGYVWFPINDIQHEYAELDVYNLSVETDESYTANGVIVHNCTDISNAGKQGGLSQHSGTRSSLCWEAIRIFKAKRPKYLLMENVKALISKSFTKDLRC